MRISIFTKQRARGGRSMVRLRPIVEGLEGRVFLSTMPLNAAAVSVAAETATTIGSRTSGAGAGKVKFNEFTIKK